jgi:hypothetical protein
VQVEAVDLGVMGGGALLEGVDGRGVEAVLDEAEGGAPEWETAYSSVCQSSGRAVTKAV